MSEKKDVSDSYGGDNESDSNESASESDESATDSNKDKSTSDVAEDKKSTHDKVDDVSNTAFSNEPPNLVSEEDVANVLQKLESRAQNTIVNVEDRVPDDEGTVSYVISSVLASQIKKMAPSVNMSDKLISEAVKEPSDTSLDSKSTSSSKLVQFDPVVRKFSIISEVESDDTAKLDDQSTKEVIDEAVKKIPGSMTEKRQRRDTLMILLKKATPWYIKLLIDLRRFSARLFEYQLWHEHLRKIEGRFGVAVVSYFLFIRWLLFMNIIILLLNLIFLVLPQFSLSHPVDSKNFFNGTLKHSEYMNLTLDYLQDKDSIEMHHKNMYALEANLPPHTEINNSSVNSSSIMKIVWYCHKRYETEYGRMKYSGFLAKIQSILDGRGWLESTLLFIGSYDREEIYFLGFPYNVPLAFLRVFIISFIICFVMMIRYTSSGIKEAFLSRHQNASFANEVFSAWDFCIRTPEAADLHRNSIMVTLKSKLFEARREKELRERSFRAWIKLYAIRVLVNICVLLWIAGCYTLIYEVAVYQLNEQKKKNLQSAGFRTLFIQYLPPITVTGISIVSPMFFNFSIAFEKYHAQTEVNVSLIRNVFLSLSSIIVMVNAFHREVTCTPKDICGAGKGADCKTPLCWETYVGQQLYKLNLSQLFVIVASFVLFDVPREYLVEKWPNRFTRLIGKATFFLPTEVLVAVYSQTILWLGVFYSPLLPAVTCIKLTILFYIKKTKVLKYSQKSKVHYKASRFNSTFIIILVLSFLAALIIHLYTIANIRPSLGCTPFSHYNSMLLALRDAFQFLGFDIVSIFELILSRWCSIPCSIILCIAICYYQKHLHFLKNMEENLKNELIVLGQDKKFLLQKIEALAKNK